MVTVENSFQISKFSNSTHRSALQPDGSMLPTMAYTPFSSISSNLGTDMESGCSTGWHFNTFFHANGDKQATIYFDSNCAASVGNNELVRHLLKTHLMTKERPASIGYMELCFLPSDVAVCVAQATAKTTLSDIPF